MREGRRRPSLMKAFRYVRKGGRAAMREGRRRPSLHLILCEYLS